MNLFWASLSKKKKIQVLILGIIGIVFVVGIILLLVRLFAQGVCPAGHICNEATVTWDDTGGSHYSATSNMTDTAINAPTQTTIKYSLQNVKSPNQTDSFTLKLYNGTNLIETQTVSGTDIGSNIGQGMVALTSPAGTYDFQFKDVTHLSKKITGQAYNPSSPPTIDCGIILGADLNGDNVVNTADFSKLTSVWGTADATADINKDGRVNTADYSILVTNWNKLGN